MLMNFALGISMMVVCLFLQGLLVLVALRFFAKREHMVTASFASSMRVTAGMMAILIAGNIIQVIAWGTLFYGLGEFEEFSVAVYHSAVNFATLGYGDIVMSPKHELLGPLEALNGVLMVGVTTAALSRAFSEALKDRVPPAH
ncbi:ion channel [Gilvimarinus xylanilyticus]|uniref:Potassium channel family protein n=1 Tax=Gilvimarinus xylanilyticus TaxID=2944139 RepID=A0A9X2KTY7_9GAMM|nr:ion channel [Gilvimarinus xylanilyticus]MCP8899278.1 potassium channel family protein [Gilvimarinus xylanilyticus]